MQKLLNSRPFLLQQRMQQLLQMSARHSSQHLQGRRQAVRQQVLILPCVGSNPAAPAIFFFKAKAISRRPPSKPSAPQAQRSADRPGLTLLSANPNLPVTYRLPVAACAAVPSAWSLWTRMPKPGAAALNRRRHARQMSARLAYQCPPSRPSAPSPSARPSAG